MSKKVALVDSNNKVHNLIMWDNTCIEIPGYLHVELADNATPCGVNWDYDPETGTFSDPTPPDAWKEGWSNYELRRVSYPPLGELADALVHQQNGNDAPMQIYLAKCQAVKDQYPL